MFCLWLKTGLCNKCNEKCDRYFPSRGNYRNKKPQSHAVGRPTEKRTTDIVELLRKGEKVRNIAEKYKVSTQYVYQIKQRVSL